MKVAHRCRLFSVSAQRRGALLSVAFTAVLFTMGLLPLAAAARAQSPEAPVHEHPRWVAASHQLEDGPLDPSANHNAEVALQEIKTDPNFHLELGPAFFNFFKDLTNSGYPYQAQMVRLYMLGSSTYLIENGKSDTNASSVYALNSVLKGYNAILLRDPAARNKVLDNLEIVDLKGKLPEYVAKAH